MANLAKRLTIAKRFKRSIKVPKTGQKTSNPKIYNVMDNSRRLSEKSIISKGSANSGPLESSLSIMNAFGISVVEETENIEYTLVNGAGLDQRKLETLQKTADYNPNRPQLKKFKTLKNKRVSLSKNFGQTVDNPIYETDECKVDSLKAETESPSNIIELTNDFIDFSSVPLTTRMV